MVISHVLLIDVFFSVLCADVPIFFRRRDLGNGLGLETCWSFVFKARPVGKLVCIRYLHIEQQLWKTVLEIMIAYLESFAIKINIISK